MARFPDGFGFDHDIFYPLTGSHRRLTCGDCHSQGYAGTPTDCYACHRADYEGADDPDHRQAGYPTSCESCHGTGGWDGAVVDHNQFFPLTGGHAGLDCDDCHANGFAGTPTDCYACHRADYDSTDDPNHSQAGFPTDCESCHNTQDWGDASFDHSDFPLTGGHRGLDCEDCHADGYSGTPTDCYACHRADYDSTDDPNHSQAGFPTDCESCHNTRDWEDASFNHDGQYFPIYSGEHRGEWDRCSDCHTVASNYSHFECTTCHEHSRSEMDDEHRGVAGYVYESSACYNCHPNGRE